ncbi:MAG: hypothetical protein ACRDV7_07555 [Acidimicrobiia bacterium]
MLTVLLRRATWTGLRRGMGGSRPYMILAILAVGARSMRRISRTQPEVLFRTKIKPGDIFVLGAREGE